MKESQSKTFHTAIEDHSVEGLEIVQEKSSFLAHGLLYLVLLFIGSALVWSFFSKLDIVVRVQGHLEQEAGVHKIYSPADGELVDMYASDGIPVKKDEIVARVKSTQAIQVAMEAEQAKYKVDAVAQEKSSLAEKERLFDAQIANIDKQIQIGERQIANAKLVGINQLTETQRHKLTVTKLKVEEAENGLAAALNLFEKYKILHDSPGGGGISDLQYKEKELEFKRAEGKYQQALIEYEELEQEFNKQNAMIEKEVHQGNMQLLELKHKRSEIVQQKKNTVKSLELRYAAALSAWKSISRITFSNIDKDNFLIIRSPIDGEVISIQYKQGGDKVKSTAPIIILSPEGSKKVLAIAIPDKDRGLLRVGQHVKMKFKAFPFHRFGIIRGEVEYLSSTAQTVKDGIPYYKGYVSIDKDYFLSDGIKIPLRYGMLASAEIIVQQRRFIDLAIEPFRKMKI